MDKNKLAVALFDKHAENYQSKFMDTSMYHESFDVFCEALKKPNAEILELACGPGNITKYLLSKKSELKILATDLSEKMLALAALNNPTAQVEIFDSRKILSLHKKFDGIMCGFCFPYLSKDEAIQVIADSAKALNENGAIYISTMEDDYHKSGIQHSSTGDSLYMYFHEENYLKKALEENGFSVIFTDRKRYQAPNGTDTCDLILIAKK